MNQIRIQIGKQYKKFMVDNGILWCKYASIKTMYNEACYVKKMDLARYNKIVMVVN